MPRYRIVQERNVRIYREWIVDAPDRSAARKLTRSTPARDGGTRYTSQWRSLNDDMQCPSCGQWTRCPKQMKHGLIWHDVCMHCKTTLPGVESMTGERQSVRDAHIAELNARPQSSGVPEWFLRGEATPRD
jgi:hypothetical protein